MRILISPDASYVYGSGGGCPSIINTSTGSIVNGIAACDIGDGNEDMAISSDGSVLLTSDLLTDPLLNIEGGVTYVDRDVWLALSVYGQKLNSDGSLVFTPLTTGIDVHDGTTGLLVYRVELPIQLANAYDALAIGDAGRPSLCHYCEWHRGDKPEFFAAPIGETNAEAECKTGVYQSR